ncbi:MAG: gliding motility-associated C-terminal domain-containing protein [Bacteroidia bacterium]|nr:gliding motility-associated C-terminal domain-containing protein [Bacteroidia bacterium]
MHRTLEQIRFGLLCFFLISGFLAFSTRSQAQCSANIDLNTWTEEGPPANGNWVVNGPGTQVTQTINSEPTFFVSPQDYINVRINGTIQVNTAGDDDFVGFVFGYRNPFGQPGPYDVETWLFDWKQGNQTSGGIAVTAGQYLAEVNIANNNLNTMANYGTTFWGHQNQPSFNILGSITGPGTGWVDFTVYNFTLTYLSTRAIIVINNDTIFDVPGCFLPGRFGFYNYSQGSVIYSNFSYELLPDYSMGSNNVCLNDSAEFYYVVDTCATVGFVNPLVATWVWDFGDGSTGIGQNINHQYAAIGSYNVKLIVTDSLGCKDSTTNTVNILPVPPPPTGSGNTPLCEGDTLNLSALSGVPFVTYDWTGPNGFVAGNAQNPTIDGVVAADSGDYYVTVTLGPCSSDPDTVPIVVHALPPAPVPGSNSPICNDSSIQLTASTISGVTYNWTGPNSFTSSQQNPIIPNATAANGGWYYVSTTRNSCDGPNDSVFVTVNPQVTAGISGDTTICIGDSTVLAASGGSSFLWSNGSTTVLDTIFFPATAPITLVAFDGDGCPSLPFSRTVLVNPLPTPFIGNDTTVCDSLQLDAGTGYLEYLWTGGATTQTLKVYASGMYVVQVMSIDSCYATDTINVTVNFTPAAPTAGSNSPICTDSTLDLTASGILGATYDWTGPNGFTSSTSNPSINNVSAAHAGIYAVTATLNGCTGPAGTTIVVVNPIPVAQITGDTTICIGDNFTLAASGGTSYAWSTGGNTSLETAPLAVTGPVSVIAFDAIGCPSASDQVTVIVNPLPTPFIGNDTTVCDSLILDGGSGYLEYLWSDNSSNQNLTVYTSGLYWVEVLSTDSCTARDTINITVNYTPAAPNAGSNSPICTDSTLDLTATGAAGASFDWTGPNSFTSATANPSINNVTAANAGVYSVTATLNGCTSLPATTNVVVNPIPVTQITGDTTICVGDNFTLAASGGTSYAWSTGGNTSLETAPLAATGPVSVIAFDAIGCPSAPDQVTVIVNALPTPFIGNDTTVCDSLILDAGPGYLEYLWSDNSTNQNLTIYTPGLYWVEVMNTDSCVARDSILITLFNITQISLGPDADFCVGDSLILQATPGTLSGHIWSTGATGSPTETVFTTGQFSVIATDANGCRSYDTIQVGNYPLLSGDIGNDTIICFGFNLLLDAGSWGGASYVWSPGNTGGQTYQVTSPGPYSVIIDDGNGCLSYDSIQVTYDVPPTLNLTSTANIICQGDPVTFIVNPAIMPGYVFYNGGNVTQTGPSPTWSTTSLVTGNQVTVQGISVNGCSTAVAGPVSVTVLPRPTGSVTAPAVCDGQTTIYNLNSSPGLTITWTGQDGLTGNASLVTHTYPGPGSYSWSVKLDNGICDTTLTGTAVVHPIPADPLLSDTLVCLGQPSPLFADGDPTLEWFTTAVGGNPVATGASFLPGLLTQNTTYWVHSTANGCYSARVPVTVTVSQPPVADFLSSPEPDSILYLPNTAVSFIDLSTSAAGWNWDFGDGNSSILQHPVHQYLNEGSYTVQLIVVNADGCPDTLSRGLYEVQDLLRIYIPNAFSPNGDDLNDDFRLYFLGVVQYNLLIFDRWGKLLFDNNGNVNQFWDGTFQGKGLPEGVYVYRLTVTDWKGGTHERRGSITLVR